MGFTQTTAGALRLRVRLTPNARTDGLGGTFTDSAGSEWLKASVRAVAEKGRANEALIALVARRSGIAGTRIKIASGATARAKTLLIEDCSDGEAAAIEALGKAS